MIISIAIVAVLLPTLLVTGWLARLSADAERAQIEKNIPRVYEDLGKIYEQRGLKQLAEQAQAKSRALAGVSR